MSKKVIRQIKALERFKVRKQMEGESPKEYGAYLARKSTELDVLIKVKNRYNAL